MLREIKAKNIMLREVLTISPDASIPIAKLKTIRKGIGGLPVVEDGRLIGIITHRDVILVGDNIAGLKVRDIMSKNVVTVGEDTPLVDIVTLMKEKGYQRIPVVTGGRLVGLITQSSIINILVEEFR